MLTISIIAIIVSMLSLAHTIWKNSERTWLRRQQQNSMRILSSRAVVLWQQIWLVLSATANKNPIDTFVFPSMQENAKRLEDALDHAIGIGLLPVLVEDREGSLVLHVAFVQSLASASQLSDKNPMEPWLGTHLLMGMVRLLDVCLRYRTDLLPSSFKDMIRPKVIELKDEAWVYWKKSEHGKREHFNAYCFCIMIEGSYRTVLTRVSILQKPMRLSEQEIEYDEHPQTR